MVDTGPGTQTPVLSFLQSCVCWRQDISEGDNNLLVFILMIYTASLNDIVLTLWPLNEILDKWFSR